MPRYENPYYNTATSYGVDPTFGAIAQNLGAALFGNPELAAQMQLREAQARAYGANADESIAHGGLYTEQAQQARDVSAARARWAGMFGDMGVIGQGNPEDFTPEAYNKGRAGEQFLGAAQPGGAPLQEDQARWLGAVLGMLPDDNTAYTAAQGAAYQGANNATKLAGDRMQADASMYGADASAGASRYNTDVDANTAVTTANIKEKGDTERLKLTPRVVDGVLLQNGMWMAPPASMKVKAPMVERTTTSEDGSTVKRTYQGVSPSKGGTTPPPERKGGASGARKPPTTLPAPPGMTQIGTYKGRPVYKDAQGNRFVG